MNEANNENLLNDNMADYEIGIVDSEEFVVQGIFDAIISEIIDKIIIKNFESFKKLLFTDFL